MLPSAAGREASLGVGASVYERHRPERTLLYQLVEDRIALKCGLLLAQGCNFWPTLRRSVRPRVFDELTIVDGIAEKGPNPACTATMRKP